MQSLGNFVASAVAGLLWAAFSPAVAFAYLTSWTLLDGFGLLAARRR